VTAPFSPHRSRLLWLVCFGAIAVAVSSPFARREDWLGWLSFAVVAAFAVFLWAILAIGGARAALAWCRDPPTKAADPRIGDCYAEHVYTISWNQDFFSVRTHSGEAVIQVPLDNVLSAISIDSLILDGDVTIITPGGHVVFPKSRSARSKIEQLICDLGRTSSHVKCRIEQHRSLLSIET
jgi:hypothetical protein